MTAILRKGIVIAALSGISLTGCMSTGTKVSNPVDIITNDAYLVNIPDAQIMPTKSELQGAKARVVVLPVRVAKSSNYETGAEREISSKIENGLLDAGVDIVDRSLAGKLGDEIIAYEATGQYSGAGIDVADVAILPSINNVQINANFTPAQTYTNDGKTYTNPAQCTYRSEVSGNVKLYKLPDLASLDGITLNGLTTQNSQSNNSNCPISTAVASSLAAEATDMAVFDIMHQIKKHFGQSGYVIEYRKRGDDHLVNINLGSNQGIKPGQKIQFAHKIERTNRISGAKTISVIPYEFIGTVSDLIDPDSSWVIVDLQAETKLKFGDVARSFYEEPGMVDKLFKKMNLTN